MAEKNGRLAGKVAIVTAGTVEWGLEPWNYSWPKGPGW